MMSTSRWCLRLTMLGIGMGVGIGIGMRPASADETELRLRFEKGKTLRLDLTDRSTTTIESPMGENIQVEFELLLYTKAKVTAVDKSGTATLKPKITRVRLALDNELAGSFKLDTDRGKGRSPDRRLAAIVGKTFTVKVSARGEVKSVKGFSKFVKVMAKAAPDPKFAMRLFELEAGDAALKAKMQDCWGPLAKAPVAVGAKWKAKLTARLTLTGNEMRVQPECTLEKQIGDFVICKLKGDITGKSGRATLWDDRKGGGGKRGGGGGGFPGAGGMSGMIQRVLANTTVHYERGEFIGSREIDLKSGLCKRGEARWTSHVRLDVKLPAGLPGGMGGGDQTAPGSITQHRVLVCEYPEKKAKK